MDSISNMTVFVKVVERKSFTAAAQALNCSTSSISKRITQLEHDIGAKLLNRTTHSVLSLTEAGKVYFDHARRIIYDIELAKDSVLELTESLRGNIRVHMTPGTGLRLAMPVIMEFMKSFTDIAVEISILPEAVDILRMGFDVSIRSGAMDEDEFNLASIEARQLSQAKYAIYASPDYLARCGQPSAPEELVHHNCLISARQHSPTKWWFWRDHKKYPVYVNGTLVADNLTVIYEAARAGLGIVRILQLHPIRREFEELVPMFTNLTNPDRVLWAIAPNIRPRPRKVTVFLDFLTSAFARPQF